MADVKKIGAWSVNPGRQRNNFSVFLLIHGVLLSLWLCDFVFD